MGTTGPAGLFVLPVALMNPGSCVHTHKSQMAHRSKKTAIRLLPCCLKRATHGPKEQQGMDESQKVGGREDEDARLASCLKRFAGAREVLYSAILGHEILLRAPELGRGLTPTSWNPLGCQSKR